MSGPRNQRCGDCACWEPTEGNFGFCRARAPVPSVLKGSENEQYTLVWPSTGRDDWCVRDFEPAAPTSPKSVPTTTRKRR